MNNITSIWFDLDGTLLQWDAHGFLKEYVKTLAGYAAPYMDSKIMVDRLWSATYAMVANSEKQRTNQQVFEEHFLKGLEVNRDTLWRAFDTFYEEAFPKLNHYTHKTDLSKQIVEEAKRKGFRVVLATNPVFPEVAIRHRIEWAGLSWDDFEWVPTYEQAHFCKPNPLYYEELLDQTGLKPEQVMMVGNDMQEDMIASTVGMKTFWVKDQAINRDGEKQFKADLDGTLQDFYALLKAGELEKSI